MTQQAAAMARNVALYPWFKFCQNLLFWQAIWFLYFQSQLSAAEAVLLYAFYDVATTVLEVPSGYMSDRWGRRRTLIAAAVAGCLGAGLIAVGGTFAMFAAGQILLGASAAFASGTDNAMLYESLAGTGRAAEVEQHETRAWQFTLAGLAISAVTGGLMAQVSYELAFAAGALSLAAALVVVWRFAEPRDQLAPRAMLTTAQHWQYFRQALRQPVLLWLLGLSVLMYGYSHLPFVFGQPFIAEALQSVGWRAEAPLVSGTTTAVMMLVSALASLGALGLRRRIGLPATLLLAFAIQIALVATLAATNAVLAIAVLFLRMVPNSLSSPFIVARMQPLLDDEGRATFLSVKSLGGRLLFAGSLLLVSAHVPDGAEMGYADIRMSLTWYALAGLLAFVILLLTVRRAGVEPEPQTRIR